MHFSSGYEVDAIFSILPLFSIMHESDNHDIHKSESLQNCTDCIVRLQAYMYKH